MSLSISAPAVRWLVSLSLTSPLWGRSRVEGLGLRRGCSAYTTVYMGECVFGFPRREQLSDNGREVADDLISTFEAGSAKALAPAVRGYDAVYCWVEGKRKSGSYGR